MQIAEGAFKENPPSFVPFMMETLLLGTKKGDSSNTSRTCGTHIVSFRMIYSKTTTLNHMAKYSPIVGIQTLQTEEDKLCVRLTDNSATSSAGTVAWI